MSDDTKKVIADFKEAVHMTAQQLPDWPETDESREVGYKGDKGGESVGHHSGRRIIDIFGKKMSEYTEDDLRHMAKVVGYIHRHLAQRPEGSIEETSWRYSLMNWGHDPAKKKTATRKAKASSR